MKFNSEVKLKYDKMATFMGEYNKTKIIIIHPAIFCTEYPTQGCWESIVYPRGLGAQGRIHHALGASS